MHHKKVGFSLIELIVTILLIGIVGAVAIPRLFQSFDDAHDAAFQTFATNLMAGLQTYRSDYLLQGKGGSVYGGYKVGKYNALPEPQHINDCKRLVTQFAGYQHPDKLYVVETASFVIQGMTGAYQQEYMSKAFADIISPLSDYDFAVQYYRARSGDGYCYFVYIGDPGAVQLLSYNPNANTDRGNKIFRTFRFKAPGL